MSKELWGVFFEDSGTEYLVAVFETEAEATSDAEERDMVAFSEILPDPARRLPKLLADPHAFRRRTCFLTGENGRQAGEK